MKSTPIRTPSSGISSRTRSRTPKKSNHLEGDQILNRSLDVIVDTNVNLDESDYVPITPQFSLDKTPKVTNTPRRRSLKRRKYDHQNHQNAVPMNDQENIIPNSKFNSNSKSIKDVQINQSNINMDPMTKLRKNQLKDGDGLRGRDQFSNMKISEDTRSADSFSIESNTNGNSRTRIMLHHRDRDFPDSPIPSNIKSHINPQMNDDDSLYSPKTPVLSKTFPEFTVHRTYLEENTPILQKALKTPQAPTTPRISKTPNVFNTPKTPRNRYSVGERDSIFSSPSSIFVTPHKSPYKYMFHPSPMNESLKNVYNLSFQPSKKPTSLLLNNDHSVTTIAEQIEEISHINFRLASYLMYGLHLLYRYKVHFISRQAEKFKRENMVLRYPNFESLNDSMKESNLKTLQQLNIQLRDNSFIDEVNKILLGSNLPPMLDYRIRQEDNVYNDESVDNIDNADNIQSFEHSLRQFEWFLNNELLHWRQSETQIDSETNSNMDARSQNLNETLSIFNETPSGPRRASLSHQIMDLPPIDLDFIVNDKLKIDFQTPSPFFMTDKRIDSDINFDYDDIPMMNLLEVNHLEDGIHEKSKKRKRVIVDAKTNIDNTIFASWIQSANLLCKKRKLCHEDPLSMKCKEIHDSVEISFRYGNKMICHNNYKFIKDDVEYNSLVVPQRLKKFFLEDILQSRNQYRIQNNFEKENLPQIDYPDDWECDLNNLDSNRFEERSNILSEDSRNIYHSSIHLESEEKCIEKNIFIKNMIEEMIGENKTMTFKELIQIITCKSKIDVSRTFYQILVLVNERRIVAQQSGPFENIQVKLKDL